MGLTNKEQEILNGIVVGSENNPNRPEFPADNPKFPATPTYKINVPGFSNVWLIDESVNPTGTHKDHMAWEIIVTYRNFLLAKERNGSVDPLPHMSIISSGSAAVAIQTALRTYQLPCLKVLADLSINPHTLQAMRSVGCEVYQTDLSRKVLNFKKILALTHNQNGFDITSGKALDPTTRFYDWLSYEIINNSPDYCFIPFGTGNLYENILNINKKEVSSDVHDPRFSGDISKLRQCHFLGATTNNPKSQAAEKLYSPHHPFMDYDEQWISLYRAAGYCGTQSGVRLIEESCIYEAVQIAAYQNIIAEPSALAGFALMLQMKNELPKDKKIVIMSTGKMKYPVI